MADESDPDKLMGPGGISMRELHELVKQSATRDRAAAVQAGKPAQKLNRWQRFVHYVRGEKNRVS
jgi:hypothetical protein